VIASLGLRDRAAMAQVNRLPPYQQQEAASPEPKRQPVFPIHAEAGALDAGELPQAAIAIEAAKTRPAAKTSNSILIIISPEFDDRLLIPQFYREFREVG